MADTFKGIVTADGKKRQLPYGSILDLPSSDPSLTVEGGFADAAVVGKKNKKTDEAIASLKEDLDESDYRLSESIHDISEVVESKNKYDKTTLHTNTTIYAGNGNLMESSGKNVSEFIDVKADKSYTWYSFTDTGRTINPNIRAYAMYNADGSFVSHTYYPFNYNANADNSPITFSQNGKIRFEYSGELTDVIFCEYDGNIPSTPLEYFKHRIIREQALSEEYLRNILSKWKNIKWCCFGDSLTEMNGYTTRHYYDYIAEKTGVNIEVNGVGGTGYRAGYQYNNAFYQRASGISSDVDVVTIFGSGNDIGKLDWGSVTDTDDTTLFGCMNMTIDAIYNINPIVKIGIVSPTPWQDFNPNTNNSMKSYASRLKEFAESRGIPFLDLYKCSTLRPWEQSYRKLCYSKDNGGGTHPNEKGHEIIAPMFEAFLDSLLLH